MRNWVSLHPSLLRAALGEELVAPQPPISLASIAARAMHIPMRKTNKQLSGKSSGPAPCQPMNPEAMRHLLNMMGISAGGVSLPGFKLLTGRGAGQNSPGVQQPPLLLSGQMQLPLPSMPSETLPEVPEMAVPPAVSPASLPPRVPLAPSSCTAALFPTPADSLVKQPSVVSAAEMLTNELHKARAVEAKVTEAPDGKPANVDEGEEELPHGQPKTVQKPAKKVAKKKEPKTSAPQKTCTKSKKAVPKASVSKKHKDDLALRRDAGIPTALLRKFADGCSRCRSRPLCTKSCSALRGYTLS